MTLPDQGAGLSLLHEVSRAIEAASSTREALAATLRLLCEAGDWVAGQMWLPEADGTVLVCSPEWYQRHPGVEPFHTASREKRLRPGESQVGLAWVTGAITWAEDLRSDPLSSRRPVPAAWEALRTALLLPVVTDGAVVAVLELLTLDERPVGPELRDSIAAVAARLGRLAAREQAEVRDVLRLRRILELEEALRREREEARRLREREESLTTLLDAISHEVRTPLAVMRLAMSMLGVDGHGPAVTEDDRRRYLAQLRRSADKVVALVGDLRASDGAAPTGSPLTRHAVGELVQRSVARHRSVLGVREVRWDVEHVVREVDEALSSRMVDTLVRDVAEHTADGTSIPVFLTTEGPGALPSGEAIGDGVEPGSGLSVVARRVRAHGGRAWVRNGHGGVAGLHVLLPVRSTSPGLRSPVGPVDDVVSLVICDDHRLLTDALAMTVATDVRLCLVAPPVDNAADAVALAARFRPDVVLMDIELKGPVDGISATRHIREVSPATKVVVISGRHRGTVVVEAIEAGAAAFVEKTAAVEDVLGLVHAAAKGELLIDPSELARLLPALAAERRNLEDAQKRTARLTRREKEILALMVEGCRADAVARRLHISLATARTHIQNILFKLDVHSQLEAVALAARSGILGDRTGCTSPQAPRTSIGY